MRSIIIALIVSVVLNIGYGQQERQYSQFMYNKLAINPAFAGALPSTSFDYCTETNGWASKGRLSLNLYPLIFHFWIKELA